MKGTVNQMNKREYFKISRGVPFETINELLGLSYMAIIWYESCPEDNEPKMLVPRGWFDCLNLNELRKWVKEPKVFHAVLELVTDDTEEEDIL